MIGAFVIDAFVFLVLLVFFGFLLGLCLDLWHSLAFFKIGRPSQGSLDQLGFANFSFLALRGRPYSKLPMEHCVYIYCAWRGLQSWHVHTVHCKPGWCIQVFPNDGGYFWKGSNHYTDQKPPKPTRISRMIKS